MCVEEHDIKQNLSRRLPEDKQQIAGLLVEGEELDVDGAGGLVDGGRLPDHGAVGVQRGLGHQSHLVVPVGADRARGGGGGGRRGKILKKKR